MSVLNFTSYSLWLNALIFVAAAAAVWWAGARVTRYADAISEMTGLGQALIGLLLLGGITSLPEIAVSVTAGITGNAGLAVSNILGGVALQVVIIAVGDALLRRHAMTFKVARPAILLQAVFSCLLLCIVVAAVVVGDAAVLGVGLWSSGILVAGIFMLWLISRYRNSQAWRPDPEPEPEEGEQEGKPGTLRRAVLLTSGAGAIILVAGFLLSKTGEAIAGQTGISENFVGATLVGIATSLPEISTVVTAVRIRRYMMAFSDIFGTNIFDVMLIFLVDVAYPGPPVISEQGSFAAFGALLGAVVTLIYVAGLIERRNKTLMRLGMDSWFVIAAYLCGVGALYYLS
jgi:cation:H+ antiporter